MQLCNRIYYSTIHWRRNMFQAAYLSSSSGALTLFAASGLHTHVMTGRSQVWVGTGLRLDYGRSPHAYVNQRLQIQLEPLMMRAVRRSKHVQPSMNGGIINSITRLHLVGYFYWVIFRCTDPWILKKKIMWMLLRLLLRRRSVVDIRKRRYSVMNINLIHVKVDVGSWKISVTLDFMH